MNNSQTSYFSALAEAANIVNSSQKTRVVLDEAVKTVSKVTGAAGCSLMLLDVSKTHLVHYINHGLSDWYWRKGFVDVKRSELMEHKAIVITDAFTDPHVQHHDMAQKAKIASMLVVPLWQNAEAIGALAIYSHEPRQFNDSDIRFLTAIADLVAMVIEKSKLKELVDTGRQAQTKETVETKLASELRYPPKFANVSEKAFARLLDFYRVEWLYEPRSFPLRTDGDQVLEMFTPDFYLPELDLYLELTTLKQSLITEKNRKVRRLKELYPELNIKLLTKKDYHQLLTKYGYGYPDETRLVGVERLLLNNLKIQRKVRQLAKQISQDYQGRTERPLLLVGVLKGVICFMADLMRHLSLPVGLEFLAISYFGSDRSSAVKITKDLDINITGRDVLMVEDIVDTGMTLNFILNYLKQRNPASLKVCTLLDKRVRRLVDVPLDYVGFEIPDEFIVGYGLDYRGRYRNLPFIGAVNPELVQTSTARATTRK